MIYLFDVDGTLTPSRDVMHPRFKKWFKEFVRQYPVAFVSGSDAQKTIEQVGYDLFSSVEYSFNCAGNEIYHHGNLIYRSDWHPGPELMKYLSYALVESTWSTRTGNHVEIRTGMTNFSIIGRNCTQAQREAYYAWDSEHHERATICSRLKDKFPELTFEIGGQISIDIFPNGCDKSQVLKHLIDRDINFFGDRMEPGGNDHTLAHAIIDNHRGRCYNVNNWYETEKELLALCPNV